MDTVKMTILPEAIYRFNAISIKLPTAFFTKLKQKNFTICMETQKTPNSQSNPQKQKQSGGIRLPDFRLYYKATIIKTVWYWHKNRNTGSMEQTEHPEISPHTKTTNKGGKTIQMWKDSLFNKWRWENWTATCKRMKLRHSLIPLHQNKLKNGFQN